MKRFPIFSVLHGRHGGLFAATMGDETEAQLRGQVRSQVQLGNEGNRRYRGGFTLLEMIITMAIFVLLAAAVFGIITAVLTSASGLQDNQNHRDQMVALNDFLKKRLQTMTPQSGLTTYRRGDGEGLAQNGIIFGDNGHATAIDAKVQGNGYYTLRLATFVASTAVDTNANPAQFFQDSINQDDSKISWTPLIRDIKTIAWKFQDFNATTWADLWNNASAKPNLVELSIQLAGDLQPATMDFWIPPLQPITVAAPQTNTPDVP